jgi:riboflavin kinase/FMN adenylyltransferase
MNVIYAIGKVKKKFKNAVLAIGVFDGVHRGHQALIQGAVRRARQLGGEPLVMTFWPHPVHVLRPELGLPYIISLQHRLKLIEELGAKACIVVHFTRRFARLSPEQFIRRYIVARIHPEEIYVGDDFRFGQGREGTLKYFEQAGTEYGFKVRVVDAVKIGEKKIGSSLIRQLIGEGKLAQAAKLLGRGVSVMGKVVHGDGRGKKLGFPTANIFIQNGVIPPLGVYAVRVRIGKKIFNGMANIGRRPSFKKNDRVHLETHIFNFHRSLYNKEIIVEFVQKIREEKKFDSRAQFIAQLRDDRTRAQRILS